MDWFFSDTHFGHEYAFKLRNRDSVISDFKEFESFIINNILSPLKAGDNLYCLGDLSFKYNEVLKNFLDKLAELKVNFHWIEGNHDKKIYSHKAIVYKGAIKDIKIEDQYITLCHYPMYIWNKSHRNSWQLFGHIHKNDFTDKTFPYENLGKQLNVNIEFHDFKPYSFLEIKEIMNTKKDNFDLIKEKIWE